MTAKKKPAPAPPVRTRADMISDVVGVEALLDDAWMISSDVARAEAALFRDARDAAMDAEGFTECWYRVPGFGTYGNTGADLSRRVKDRIKAFCKSVHAASKQFRALRELIGPVACVRLVGTVIELPEAYGVDDVLLMFAFASGSGTDIERVPAPESNR